MPLLLWILLFVAAFVVVLLLGLRVPPPPFAPPSVTPGEVRTRSLPGGLPAPVERFYRRIYGEEIPEIESAVVSGRALLRIGGIPMAARFRFIHSAGNAYRHFIQTGLFGVPILTVRERFIDGSARLELPFGVTEHEPRVDAGANQALWAEAVWFPSLWLTDGRARWEAVDDESALLFVPRTAAAVGRPQGDKPTGHAEPSEQSFLIRFDPETDLLSMAESMRYKSADDPKKYLWLNSADDWVLSQAQAPTEGSGGDARRPAVAPAAGSAGDARRERDSRRPDGSPVGGAGETRGVEHPHPRWASVTWLDDGRPWAVFRTEELRYNARVEQYLQSTDA